MSAANMLDAALSTDTVPYHNEGRTTADSAWPWGHPGTIVEIRWNSGNDSHPDEHIDRGRVVSAGPETLWIDAEAQGVKPRQDVFIRYTHITMIQEIA